MCAHEKRSFERNVSWRKQQAVIALSYFISAVSIAIVGKRSIYDFKIFRSHSKIKNERRRGAGAT